jgi:hypothetical protein
MMSSMMIQQLRNKTNKKIISLLLSSSMVIKLLPVHLTKSNPGKHTTIIMLCVHLLPWFLSISDQ